MFHQIKINLTHSNAPKLYFTYFKSMQKINISELLDALFQLICLKSQRECLKIDVKISREKDPNPCYVSIYQLYHQVVRVASSAKMKFFFFKSTKLKTEPTTTLLYISNSGKMFITVGGELPAMWHVELCK